MAAVVTGLVDLFVLRRIAVLGEDDPCRATLHALQCDCSDVDRVESRLCSMERGLLLRRRTKADAEYFEVSSAGRHALKNEPKRFRDSLSFTNR